MRWFSDLFLRHLHHLPLINRPWRIIWKLSKQCRYRTICLSIQWHQLCNRHWCYLMMVRIRSYKRRSTWSLIRLMNEWKRSMIYLRDIQNLLLGLSWWLIWRILVQLLSFLPIWPNRMLTIRWLHHKYLANPCIVSYPISRMIIYHIVLQLGMESRRRTLVVRMRRRILLMQILI